MSKAASFQLHALLWVRGGQCGRCAHAIWGGRNVTGCGLGAALEGPVGTVARIQAALLFQLARSKGAAPCVAREVVEVGPDAYLAEDQPCKEP